MATSQMIRPEEDTGTWDSLFPLEQVTEHQSTTFAKKLLAVAISSITYLRAIFPECAYFDKCLEDLNLKILTNCSSYPGAFQVIKWVRGCFDALEKKYLRLVTVGIYVDSNDPNSVIESYTFKFSYSTQCGVDIYRNGKKVATAHSAEKTKKETIQLLRTMIVLTQSLQPLPEKVYMTMKLLYYDEVTPPEYEPPGFKPSATDSFHFDEEPVNIKIGDVSTTFHSIKMRMKTDKQQFDYQDTDEADRSIVGGTVDGLDGDQDIQSQESDVYQSEKDPFKENTEDPLKEGDVPLVSPGMPEKGKNARTPPEEEKEAEDFEVECPCGCNEDDGLMIVCDICNTWQHAVCFCILEEEDAPEEHICPACAVTGNNLQRATDPYLSELDTCAAQATCLWRRALVASKEFGRILASSLAHRLGVDITVAQGLINRLEKEGFVRAAARGKRLGKVVDKEKVVKEGIPAYFRSSKKSENKIAENDIQTEKPMETGEQERQSPALSKSDDVSEMTEQAANISLSGQPVRSSPPKEQCVPQKKKVLEKNVPKKSGQNRGKKRAFSKVGQSEFEVCSSQEAYYTRSRKKKCSDAQKSIAL